MGKMFPCPAGSRGPGREDRRGIGSGTGRHRGSIFKDEEREKRKY